MPLLIFDGDCGFCTSAATWAAAGWRESATLTAWQQLGENGLSSFGLTVADAQSAAWWIDPIGGNYRGHGAVGKALANGRGLRHVAGVLILIPPISFLAAGGYAIVARYRYRLPGGTPACRIR